MYTQLRDIEAKVYPIHMQGMQEVYTLQDLQEYCEASKIKVFGDDNWYCIVSKKEVVDLASITSLPLKALIELLRDLKIWFGTKPFSMDCKVDTSYKLIKRLESQGILSIKKEEHWDWEGIAMIYLKIKFF